MFRSSITVLTDPVQVGRDSISEKARFIARHLRNWLSPRPAYTRSLYRGHFAVTRSLVEGLQKIGVQFTYNPVRMMDVAEVVVVLSGLNALRQAIRWKQSGRIRYLLAGPNILVYPSDHESIISAPEVDFCITPSEYTNRMYVKDCPALLGRCVAWSAGVNTEYWKPDSAIQRDLILIFEKQHTGSVGPVEDYKRTIESYGYKVQIIKYGNFSHKDYLQSLRRAMLMVGFVRNESQGIAWAEAWSTDVPTLIWRNTLPYLYRGKSYAGSTAPYLTPETGLFFDDLENFKTVFLKWQSKQYFFQPRWWVQGNMSDEASARMLCRIAGISRET